MTILGRQFQLQWILDEMNVHISLYSEHTHKCFGFAEV